MGNALVNNLHVLVICPKCSLQTWYDPSTVSAQDRAKMRHKWICPLCHECPRKKSE